MLSEKYNNQSWRSSLDDLDSLPGEEKASTGVSWNKLNARLQVTAKKNKRTLYLWLAAACVVISFFTVVFVSTFKQPTASSFAATKTNNKTASPNKKIEKTIVSTNTAPDHNTTITIHTNLIHSSGKKKNKASNDVFTATQTSIVASKSTVTVIEKDSLKNTNIQASLPLVKSKPIIFPALKKQIPVIHINEIEKDIRPVEAVAGNDNHRGLRIRFSSGENTMRNEVQPTYQEAGLIIKLSPQN